MKLFLNLIFTSLLLTSATFIEANANSSTNQTYQENEEFEEELSEFEEEMEIKEKSDPLNSYNRVMTDFNDGVMTYVMIPVSKGYKSITHEEFRKSINNFFHNILFPVRFVNNLLQGKFQNTGEETGRFVINSTLGIFGLFDVASKHFDLKAHNEDFGQTLGYWGVGSGPHIVLPFFGPSNLRDIVSMYPDSLTNPIDYHDDRGYNLVSATAESAAVKLYSKINDTDSVSQYEMMKKDAVDLYPYLRDMYEQYRQKQIQE